MMEKGELPTPIWFNEFVTAGSDRYGPPKGSIRMWAYQALLYYGQTFLAWTFNTHRGGEEQALFGLLDHDGTPSWKYREWTPIAAEFKKLQALGFPRDHRPEVAIAYSFDSAIASRPPSGNTARDYNSTPYTRQVVQAFQPFYEDNIDAAVGRAIYLAVPAQSSMLGPLLRSLYPTLGMERGPVTPPGVSARVVDGRTLYVNTNAAAVDVQIEGEKVGVIGGRRYRGVLHLEPYDAELLQ
jgi:hypothetical protein